jgi:hypothetical protein
MAGGQWQDTDWTPTGGGGWNQNTSIGGSGQIGVEFSYLVDALGELTAVAKSKIATIRSKKSAMSIADMFDLQMAMNKLSQFSEMSTSVISATNTACNSMARNMK